MLDSLFRRDFGWVDLLDLFVLIVEIVLILNHRIKLIFLYKHSILRRCNLLHQKLFIIVLVYHFTLSTLIYRVLGFLKILLIYRLIIFLGTCLIGHQVGFTLGLLLLFLLLGLVFLVDSWMLGVE